MRWGRFRDGYDWIARADLAVGWIFDWRNWLWTLVPTGGGMTFLWAAIDGRSPLDVWIAAVVVMAALAVTVFVVIFLIGKRHKLDLRSQTSHEAIHWKNLMEAIDEFADKSLLGTRDKWQFEFVDTFERRFQCDRALSKLLESLNRDQDEIGLQTRRKQVAVLGHDHAQDELRRAWTDLREDVRRKLERGQLAAKGIPAPYMPGKREIEIAAHEWRMLEISPNERAEAYEKGTGGCRYVGIVIGKPVS
jgi:hypothetical protein